MAAHTGIKAASATLSTTVADTVTLSGFGKRLMVGNHDADTVLYFTLNGVTAVAQADENYAVSPGSTLVLEEGGFGNGNPISVVADGGGYTVAIF